MTCLYNLTLQQSAHVQGVIRPAGLRGDESEKPREGIRPLSTWIYIDLSFMTFQSKTIRF